MLRKNIFNLCTHWLYAVKNKEEVFLKKDIFNGYILESQKKHVKGQLIATPIVFFLLGCVLMFFAVAYGDQMQGAVKNFIYFLFGFLTLSAILYPTLALLCIRNYPKCKKIMFLFISDKTVFNDKEK